VILLLVTNWGNLLGCSELLHLEFKFIGVIEFATRTLNSALLIKGEESTLTHLSTYSALSFTLF
jgi:hypothetical protein